MRMSPTAVNRIPVSAAQFFFAKSKPPAKPVVYSMPVRHFYRPR